MTTNDRFIIGILITILMAALSWTLGTISVNSGRISVLEQRADNHTSQMVEMKLEVKEHRLATEFRTNGNK